MTSTKPSSSVARFGNAVLFGLVPALVAWSFVTSHSEGVVGFDFRGTLWNAAGDVLAGRSPYPDPGSAAFRSGNPAVYPPFSMLAVAPLRALGWHAGFAVWVLLLVVAMAVGFYLLGVRDWRVYVIVFVSIPVMNGLIYGNLTLLLFLGVGAGWRYRDRPAIVGAAIGASIAAKLFLWPLMVWLLITRRFRAAAVAAAWAIGLIVVPWALTGFRGFLGYPGLLHAVSDYYGQRSFSLVALGWGLGLGAGAAVLPWIAGVAILVAAAMKSIRHPDAERSVFALCVIAAVAASPLIWQYTVALLFVPLVIVWPRLTVLLGFALVVWVFLSPAVFLDLGFSDRVASAGPVVVLTGLVALLVVMLDPLPQAGTNGVANRSRDEGDGTPAEVAMVGNESQPLTHPD